MKTKIGIFVFTLLLLILSTTTKIQAQEKASGSSATFSTINDQVVVDTRAKVLKAYLDKYNSPLAPFAQDFVTQADAYHLDWKLLVAISGVESTFGKAEPCINAWGYNIYGDTTRCFESYPDGIKTISQDIRNKYINKWGVTDVNSLGAIYAASPTWSSRVLYFMDQIDAFALANQPLPISL